jgi:hypothetical protein
VAGFVGFRRLTGDRLPLSEDMNTDIIFFSSAIGVFYSLVVGPIPGGVRHGRHGQPADRSPGAVGRALRDWCWSGVAAQP